MRAYLPLVSSPVARKRYTSPTRPTVRPCWGLRIIGFIRLVSSLFCGQCLHELRRPLDPAAQLLVALDAFRPDQHPAFHGPTSDVELLDMRLQQGPVALVGAAVGEGAGPGQLEGHDAVEGVVAGLVDGAEGALADGPQQGEAAHPAAGAVGGGRRRGPLGGDADAGAAGGADDLLGRGSDDLDGVAAVGADQVHGNAPGAADGRSPPLSAAGARGSKGFRRAPGGTLVAANRAPSRGSGEAAPAASR